MIKFLTSSLAVLGMTGAACTSAAATSSINNPPAEAIQIIHDSYNKYVYIIKPVPLTLDKEQQEALDQAVKFTHDQLKSIKDKNSVNSTADLKTISDSMAILDQKLDQLVKVGVKLYGSAAPLGIRALDAVPTGLMVYMGGQFNKGLVRGLEAGVSATFAVVWVPMSVTRMKVSNPDDSIQYVYWDPALIAFGGFTIGGNFAKVIASMATGGATDAGAAAPTPSPVQPKLSARKGRFGAGIIWGELNSASDLHGGLFGGGLTVSAGGGLNLKFLGVTNSQKKGAFSNLILLGGIEMGGDIDLTPYAIVGGVIDAKSFLGSTTQFAGETMDRISGHTATPEEK